MDQAASPVLVGLLWLVRGYRYLVIAWVLLTWIPGIAGSAFHDILGLPVAPVLNLFSFLRVGFIGFEGVIVLLLLWPLENWLERAVSPPADETQGFDATGSTVPDLSSGHRPGEPPRQ